MSDPIKHLVEAFSILSERVTDLSKTVDYLWVIHHANGFSEQTRVRGAHYEDWRADSE